MSAKGTDVFPVGKHKGKPLDEVLNDSNFVQWFLQTQNLCEKYPHIEEYFLQGEHSNPTPVHNAMQAAFLDDAFVSRFVEAVAPETTREGYKRSPVTAFENVGGYGYYRENAEYCVTYEEVATPPCVLCFEDPSGFDVVLRTWKGDIAVELKPQMGDDYPAVLRQIQANRTRYGRARVPEWVRAANPDGYWPWTTVLVVNDFNSQVISWEQLYQYFKLSGVIVARGEL